MIAARQLRQRISAIPLNTQWQHLKLPILDWAAEIRWRSLRSTRAKSFWIWVPGLGFDCFLAAGAVGKTGRVIGVDMTHEMLIKARENAEKERIHKR